jgi:HlyD family secretion protein
MSMAITLPPTTDWRRPARFGYLVIVLTFGVGSAWTGLMKINSAVIAQGVVSVDGNRKTVQHLESGIVDQILVSENQSVKQGQLLLRLSDISAKASMDTVKNQLAAGLVQEARLVAERDQKSAIELPQEIQGMVQNTVVAHAIADETATFVDRQHSLDGEVSVLESRAQGLQDEIKGLIIEQDSTRGQIAYIDQELVGLRKLLASQLVPLSRVLGMERERTRLQGDLGRAIADQAKAQNSIGETSLDIQQLRQKFQEQTATSISDIRQKIAELREKVAVATDVMGRVDVQAPVSGTVQDLKVHGVGQVIRSGEPLLEIVPDDEDLVVRAQFSPTDIDRLRAASQIEVRFPSFHARTTPVILGKLDSISADRLTDEATHQPYYLGLVSVDKLKIPQELRDRVRAGMPAEVVAPLAERSVLSYLVSPLREVLHTSMREQ